MRRRVVLATLSLLIVGAVSAALVTAQVAPPTVEVRLGNQAIGLTGAEGAAAGPTRIEFRNPSRRAPAEAGLVALRPGQTVQDFQRALRRATRGPTPLKRVVTFEAGGQVAPGGTYATTIDLRPGTTYVAIRVGEDASRSAIGTFTTGTAQNGATRPDPVAEVHLHDYAFGMPATLPRRGTLRFSHMGERLHIAVVAPLRRGANRTAALRAVIRNQERRVGRLLDFRRATELLGLVSGGTVNDVEYELRPGTYLMICFIGDGEPGNPGHNEIGMVKAFRVR